MLTKEEIELASSTLKSDWTKENVSNYFSFYGVSSYCLDKLEELQVDGDVLLALAPSDLSDIGVRETLLREVILAFFTSLSKTGLDPVEALRIASSQIVRSYFSIKSLLQSK